MGGHSTNGFASTLSLRCRHVPLCWPPNAAQTRGVLCVSGERGPKASERNALLRKGEGDGSRSRPRRRETDRKVGPPPKGKSEESRSVSRRRDEGTTQGAQRVEAKPQAWLRDAQRGKERVAIRTPCGEAKRERASLSSSEKSGWTFPFPHLRAGHLRRRPGSPRVSTHALRSPRTRDHCAPAVTLSGASSLPGVTPDPLLSRHVSVCHPPCFRTSAASPRLRLSRHTVRHQGGPCGEPRKSKSSFVRSGCGGPHAMLGGPRMRFGEPQRHQMTK
jgi:hypothetical protein